MKIFFSLKPEVDKLWSMDQIVLQPNFVQPVNKEWFLHFKGAFSKEGKEGEGGEYAIEHICDAQT